MYLSVRYIADTVFRYTGKGASLEVQQESKVSGTVTDENGEPVIGASVVVVESKQGTITDIDGKFLVNVPKNGHLKVSYIGYEHKKWLLKPPVIEDHIERRIDRFE